MHKRTSSHRRHGFHACILVLVLVVIPSLSQAFVYTVKTRVNLRTGPGLNFPVLAMLPHNQSLTRLSQENGWLRIKTPSGQTGYIRQDMASDTWIKVHKKERTLYLVKGRDTVIKKYRMALSSFNPLGDKAVLGDGGTPEGRFFISEMLKHPDKSRYGARSMRISYPSIEDARRGLKDKIITMETYRSIVKKIHQRRMPDQGTKLGGSIRIHGGGSTKDWTLGCMALDDRDSVDLFERVGQGYRVEIYHSADQDRTINRPGYLAQAILKGAKQQLVDPALYTVQATKVNRLSYPEGDISTSQAVCTDIVIRALRAAGIDLQPLVHEDAGLNPDAYKPDIMTPSFHIDHRRVRTLKRFFDRYAENLSPSPNKVRPGDIVIMDTGIQNGTVCDHIGIVSDQPDGNGHFSVINIWAMGLRTSTMSLIGREYPDIVFYYRMTHPFDYHTSP